MALDDGIDNVSISNVIVMISVVIVSIMADIIITVGVRICILMFSVSIISIVIIIIGSSGGGGVTTINVIITISIIISSILRITIIGIMSVINISISLLYAWWYQLCMISVIIITTLLLAPSSYVESLWRRAAG